ncbi:MAG: ABC transporter permease [Actinobacteria bacterium]|nr:ABC transporter permease [Actinomycetota bacterium]MCG2819234.1 ABC transporter permease [Actinomycetes bacterium]MBU4219641.1 ABC transporter permease [Actinomycetota bacterium]MBU4360106.1 ABC transporter permease [Actinomycetota bacterium]MBU4393080.1 ABC transporter permease [Actinomycetota bacterium]
MRNIWTLAVTVIRDTARKKIFYVVLLFGLSIISISPLIPTFELGSQARFLRDISLSLTSLFGVILAVILSINQVPGDVGKRTIYNLLSKPVSRLQYLVGKYLGILMTLAIILFVMGLEILVLIYARLQVFSPVIFQGVFAVFLESAIIAAFCLGLSTFVTVPVNAFATILFYMLCHVKTGFLHAKLIDEASGGLVKIASWTFYYVIPNLENFNLSEQVGYAGGVSWTFLARISGYALLFAVLFLIIGHLVFRVKDL